MSSVSVAIIGSGNIGTDLLIKVLATDRLDVHSLVGVDPDSEGLRKAAESGVRTSAGGVDWLLDQTELPDIVFEATSAKAHIVHAPRYRDAGLQAIDLTPAAVGPYVVPVVNLETQLASPNVNLITCGGQATIPIVHAVSRAARVPYAEIVASISSRSAGPGTRANIDEFTDTTAKGVEQIGGAERGKAIIILNPAEPPVMMRDTVFCAIPEDADQDVIYNSIVSAVEDVATYVPGYRLVTEPQFDQPRSDWDGYGRVTVFLQVEGNGDFLPTFAGNLDIMTAAAAKVGEELARMKTEVPA